MKIKFNYTVLLFLGLLLGSCQDFVDDLDVDPNQPPSADAQNMLQGIELADAVIHEGEAARISAMWTAQFTGANQQYNSINRYDVTAGNFDNMWSTMYVDVATQSRIAAARALQEQNPRLSGILQVLEAHTLGTATSLFGDIPFSQVNDRINFPNPVYDPQVQVYAVLQQELDEAIAKINTAGGAPRDIFYQGNGPKWAAAAYTLKARYYLHTKQYDLARQAALNGISSPANDWIMPHKESDGAENFYYQFNSERVSYLTGTDSYVARLLDPGRPGGNNRNNSKTDESARFSFFFNASSTPNNPNDYQLLANSGFADPAEDFPLLTYSENQLILAEAYARTGNLTSALTALNAHRAALTSKYPAGRYDAYTLADIPGGASQANMINEILTERYVSFIGQIEPFNDLRRTNNAIGLPNKRQLPGAPTPAFPQRFLYSQSEVNSNTNTPRPLPDLFSKTTVNQ
ncbi:SusD/RagB family nutrient-binding outer membrane lipoprotein [Hymenobacter puniceus]|uniref:SusD/RagB family nutrient-binding outer membrane lipoprotein n=1 Tax=Hymenobacter sp. BT190 TaxID=2763505 RepID=UPI00165157A2|nr:SusD/RagB family nutrient-binding outer membrane lipoprotein [Hymenobacter sp. BT190]MBC6696679.1 SusD/RagB family nutrient-binding outer membrane lipoprotein [Hymenobacter sp. BT190]